MTLLLLLRCIYDCEVRNITALLGCANALIYCKNLVVSIAILPIIYHISVHVRQVQKVPSPMWSLVFIASTLFQCDFAFHIVKVHELLGLSFLFANKACSNTRGKFAGWKFWKLGEGFASTFQSRHPECYSHQETYITTNFL